VLEAHGRDAGLFLSFTVEQHGLPPVRAVPRQSIGTSRPWPRGLPADAGLV